MGLLVNKRDIRATAAMLPAFEILMNIKNYLFIKRCLDIGVSALMIAGVLSWLLPLLALLIKLDSRGPLFFLQKRSGKGGKLFTCYKLRTMVVNRLADEAPASENDPRITRMGKILRKTHLDELPQLFNVLLGSMSLVGPRPYMMSDDRKFSMIVSNHYFRCLVKPGITGLAQVKGLHGVWPDERTVVDRHRWDAFYIRHVCLLMDLRIIRQTFLLIFTKKRPI